MENMSRILSGRNFKAHLSPKKRQGLMNAVKEQREIQMFNTLDPQKHAYNQGGVGAWHKDPSALVLPEIRQFQDSSASLHFGSGRKASVQPHRNAAMYDSARGRNFLRKGMGDGGSSTRFKVGLRDRHTGERVRANSRKSDSPDLERIPLAREEV